MQQCSRGGHYDGTLCACIRQYGVLYRTFLLFIYLTFLGKYIVVSIIDWFSF